MKKLLSCLLVLCFVLSLSFTLVSCAHKCEFSDEWTYDESSHWHVCRDESCVEISDKAEHTWDEGNITTVATQEQDGVKTFTCTVCSKTRTEVVAFTGLTEEEWDVALSADVFENFSFKEAASVFGSGVSVDVETGYKFTKDAAWVEITMIGQTNGEYAPDKEAANEARRELVDSIKAFAEYDSFEYDAETKTYKATEEIQIDSIDASTDDVTLRFADGKLVEIKYSATFVEPESNITLTANSTITLSDYGTVVLTPPEE